MYIADLVKKILVNINPGSYSMSSFIVDIVTL